MNIEHIPQTSNRKIFIAVILCFFLGTLGAHRFYCDRTTSAITMVLLTIFAWVLVFTIVGLLIAWILFGIVSIWVFVDLVILLLAKFKDSDGNILKIWL